MYTTHFFLNQDLVYFWSVKTKQMFFNSEKFFIFFFISLIIISFSLSLLLTLSFHLTSFLLNFLSGLYHTAEYRVKSTDTGPILSALKFWFYHCIHCTAYLKRSIRLQGQEGRKMWSLAPLFNASNFSEVGIYPQSTLCLHASASFFSINSEL